MKTKFFLFLIGLMCLIGSATIAQTGTFSNFNGKIQFTSFANNGANIRGTLDQFLDQTNNYFASGILVNDIVWDNQGRRYKVVAVISSNLMQAVVDLSRIGGGTHIPGGVGFVSRETKNLGLSLVPTANNLGISDQLQGAVISHNAMKVDSFAKQTPLTGARGRIVYFNSNGSPVSNSYFRVDTNTTSGVIARYRLLINNPNGDLGEGDTYSSLSIGTGDDPTGQSLFNVGDQAQTMATTGYYGVVQIYSTGGTFAAKTNLLNGRRVGDFAWRGQIGGSSKYLGGLQLDYTGDGTTILSQILGKINGNTIGFRLDNQARFWLGTGGTKYYLPDANPPVTLSTKSQITWVGDGTNATPQFEQTPIGTLSAGVGTLTAGQNTALTIVTTGAAVGDFPLVSINSLPAGVLFSSIVSAANTVTVTIYNSNASSASVGTITLRSRVWKQ